MDTHMLLVALLLSSTLLFAWYSFIPAADSLVRAAAPDLSLAPVRPHIALVMPSGTLEGATVAPNEDGWLGWLVRPLEQGLLWVARHWTRGNFGWAVVVMTLLIRIGLWPLTHRSMKHMQLMRELNPCVETVRKRFEKRLRDAKGQPNLEAHREMSEEVMAVYREAGTSPVGGCIPMLLQFPVLVAFYYLLRSTPELQQAPWILWIRDLAAPDPLYLLPILMGLTQLSLQWVQPSITHPVQRRLLLFLPVVFTLFFLHASSGLVLYWLTSNLVSLLLYRLYRTSDPDSAEPPMGSLRRAGTAAPA